MKEELGEYIHEKLIDEAKHYQWKIIMDRSKRALEIYFTVSVDIEKDRYVQDGNATTNDSGNLIFEEVICFYDEMNSKIAPNNYLIAIPLNPAVGIEQGYVDAVLKQLNIIASSAMGDLRKFLVDDTRKEFSLTWNEQNMENTVKTIRKTGRYSSNTLTLINEEEDSFVDKIKGDKNGGMERI